MIHKPQFKEEGQAKKVEAKLNQSQKPNGSL